MEVTISKKTTWVMGSYSLLTLAIMVGFMYLNTFATEVLAIPAGQLAVALGLAKGVDFVFSMICGGIIEKVKISNKGKNQSWLLTGRWILAVCCMLEVTNTSAAPAIVKLVVLSGSYIILNCLMNILQTAYYGCVAAVSQGNMANRNAMTVNMTRQSTVITIITSFIPTLVTVLPFGSWNYFVVATVFMLPMPFALGAIAKEAEGLDKPVDKSAVAAGGGVSIGDMLATLVKNPQMLVLFLTFCVLNIAQYMYQANYTYYFIYVIGDFTKMTIATLCSACAGFVAAMVMPNVGAKLGKKWSCSLGFMFMGTGLICVGLFAAKGGLPVYIAFMCAMMFGTYTYMPFMVTVYLDAGEYFLWKTGKDTRAIAAGLASPPMKIGMFIGGTVGLMLLQSTGFVSGGAFTPDADWAQRFMNVTFVLPGAIQICAGILMALFYKISDADAAKYAKENMEKMMANMGK